MNDSPDDTLICDNDVTRPSRPKESRSQPTIKGQRSRSSGSESHLSKPRRRRSKEGANSSVETTRGTDVFCTPTKKNTSDSLQTVLSDQKSNRPTSTSLTPVKMSPSKSAFLHKSKENATGVVSEKPIMYLKENNVCDFVNDNVKETEKLNNEKKSTSVTDSLVATGDLSPNKQNANNNSDSGVIINTDLKEKQTSGNVAVQKAVTKPVMIKECPVTYSGTTLDTKLSFFSGILSSGVY